MAKQIVVFVKTPEVIGTSVRTLCNSKGKNGISRNGVVRKQGNSESMLCGHAKRLLVAGKCLACEKYGPSLEVL